MTLFLDQPLNTPSVATLLEADDKEGTKVYTFACCAQGHF